MERGGPTTAEGPGAGRGRGNLKGHESGGCGGTALGEGFRRPRCSTTPAALWAHVRVWPRHAVNGPENVNQRSGPNDPRAPPPRG